ncbi:DNA translocase FtsK [hydrothermal vent metagenome]|uniref:DNA translocase FtsK n=1 Tax=hydrothermal vent metagenome TaxID=652676 RepID=A0A3B1DW85_9ZZZZ
MDREHIISEIKAVITLAVGMILLASFISFVPQDLPWYTSTPNIPAQNLIRITGAYIAGSVFFLFGYSSYFLVIVFFLWSWNQFSFREIHFSPAKFISFLVLFGVASSLFGMFGSQVSSIRFSRAGVIGFLFSDFLMNYIGTMGAYIVLTMLGILALILTGEFLVTPLVADTFERITQWYGDVCERREEVKENKIKAKVKKLEEAQILKPKINIGGIGKGVKTASKRTRKKQEGFEEEEYEEEEEDIVPGSPKVRVIKSEEVDEEYEDEEEVVGEYRIPSLDLLEDPPEVATDKLQDVLISDAKLLEETLSSFGVQARVADIERGPAITRYELEPAPGVKVQKFTNLSDDIALALKAAAVRIVAPIPGKNRVGIEVPNGSSAAVFLKEVLSSSSFRNSESKLALSFGKDITGKAMVADLASMPHLLIAGTTGSGKTVCVNGIIMSILLNATPDEVKFVMIDPKMVELAQYNDIPHLLCPTVTDPKKASAVLNWVVSEMESRYKKLAKVGARHIKGYNEKGNNMPYIVVIVDELADLMQVSSKAVEGSIARLAQLSRAVGIHLILATQRPSVDVITGVIKANFPARVSFKVASKVDSRTVLDMNGAENLLGKGDMLFIQPGDAKPTRGQGNFVTDNEIHTVIQFIKDQQAPVYNDAIIEHQKKGGAGKGTDEKDDYYDEAVRLVIETNQASVSILQRRMRLGYTRAARLIDMMEQNGIVGPYVGSKPREILVDREQWLLDNMSDVGE